MKITIKEVIYILILTLLLVYIISNIWYPPSLWLPFYEFLPLYFQNTAPAKWITSEIALIPFYLTLIAVIFIVYVLWRK